MTPNQSDQAELQRTLTRRLITGFIAGPLVVAIVVAGGLPIVALIMIGGGLAIVEFAVIIRQGKLTEPLGWWLSGLIYLTGALTALAALRLSTDGLRWVLALLTANWGTDSFAYIFGRWLGRHPLAPSISPNKTVEGALGGMASGAVLTLGVGAALGMPISTAIGIALLTPIATTGGDLIESAFKRRFGVKQSGHVLPGHGGVLDRIDGLLLAAWVIGLLRLIVRV